VAEELGVPLEDVAISRADTDITTYCKGAFGSRLTYLAGNAARNAAANVKLQILDTAAELLEASPDGRPRDPKRPRPGQGRSRGP
jgi:CO/xanthine dehydrogenase Mo-binding subunit